MMSVDYSMILKESTSFSLGDEPPKLSYRKGLIIEDVLRTF